MSHHIKILKVSTLLDLEHLTQTLFDSEGSELTIWLPRNLGSQIFKESRIVVLLASAARTRKLAVRDWIQKQVWDQQQAEARFTTI